MSLGRKVFAAPARLWMNWPLWGGLLATLLLAKHAWVLFAPAEHAVPGTTVATQPAQAEQLFGTVATASSSASLHGKSGIVLAETHADHVVLEQHGIRHRVDLSKAPAAAGGVTPVSSDPITAAQTQVLNKFTPEQQKILLQQQQGLIRGRP